MEALIPIFRLFHFLGFSLLLGGIISSFALVKKEGSNVASIRLAHTCIHMLAAPGLMLLFLTGILHSSVIHWDNFKSAGYMHAKVLLVAVIFLLMIFDLRLQKKIFKDQGSPNMLAQLIKKRQILAMSMAAITLLVMWLVSFRPF